MTKGRLVSLLGGVAMAMALGASTASAATLIGDYQFQGTRASSGPGPTLLDVGGVNSFQPDTVMGSSRQVLAFPLHSGVQMFPAGIGGSTAPYSAVTTFRLDTVSGYRRILDPSPGNAADRGIYELDGMVAIYPDGSEVDSPAAVFTPNTYATVAVTSAPPTQLKVFVNGNLAAQAAQADQTIPVVSDTLRFFKDNDSGANNLEDSAGAVSCIRVFSGLLSDAEVKAIGASATCQAPLPSNAFSFGKLKRNKRKGTATLTVEVPGPGTLSLTGKGVVKARPELGARALAAKAVTAAGKVKLLVKAKGKKKRKLSRTGKVKVKAKITYTPTGGDPNTETKSVKLIKRP